MLLDVKILLAMFLIYSDIRYLSVPVWPIVAYIFVSILVVPSFNEVSFGLTILIVLAIWGWEYLKGRHLLGVADKLVLPVIAMACPFENLGVLLISVGILSLLTAVIWQKALGNPKFPMVPALLISEWLVVF